MTESGLDGAKGDTTPYSRGKQASSKNCAAFLITNGRKSSRDDASITIHEAGVAGMVGHVRLLLDAGADVNAVDADGLALIHRAAMNGSMDLARLLVNRGANVNIREQNATGMTPLALAQWMGYHEIATFLSHYGGLL